MSSKTRLATTEATYIRLVEYLLDGFPVRRDLDYFALCQANPLCTALPDYVREAFEAVSAFIEALDSEGLIKADRFDDGMKTFFWNVAFTPEGYRRAKHLLRTRSLDQGNVDADLLLDLCGTITQGKIPT